MPIITIPPRTNLSAYRPIQYEVTASGNPNFLIENAIVDLYFKGVLVSTFKVRYTDVTYNIFPNIDEYSFCIDVSERLRDLLAPFTEVPSQFIFDCPTAPTKNADAVGSFYLGITYEGLNVTSNLIEPLIGVNDITPEAFAYAITRQNLENMFLDEFAAIFPNVARVLTNSPKELDVCREDNRFLGILHETVGPVINAFRVILYDSGGGVIGTADYFLGITLTEGEMFTINSGIENGLKCLVGFQQTPSYDLDDPNISYYTIQFGLLNLAVFTGFSEVFRYNLSDSCKCCEKRKLTLHFLNELGGVDSFDFCSIKEFKYKTTSVLAEKALPWDKTSLTPHNPADVGVFKSRTSNEPKYRIVSQNLSNQEALWLYEVLDSVKVYAELEPNVIIPVIIQDGEQTINKETGKRNLELIVILPKKIKQTV